MLVRFGFSNTLSVCALTEDGMSGQGISGDMFMILKRALVFCVICIDYLLWMDGG